MKVAQLFDKLRIVANVAIMGSLLPQRRASALKFPKASRAQRGGNLEGLHRINDQSLVGFGDEKMNVLQHHDEPVDAEAIAQARVLQRGPRHAPSLRVPGWSATTTISRASGVARFRSRR